VTNCFLFPVMPMKVVSGRSKPMRVGHHTRIFYSEENILNMRETAFANYVLPFEASFGASTFCKPIT
jgi:hypothetical protein